MKLDDIITIQITLLAAYDFISTNGDGYETTCTKDLLAEISNSRDILQAERKKNALATLLRTKNKKK